MDLSTLSLQDAVQTLVTNALPSLTNEKAADLITLIMKENPEDLRDMSFFNEEDFYEEITKLQARKLVAYIKQTIVSGTISPVKLLNQSQQISCTSVLPVQPTFSTGQELPDFPTTSHESDTVENVKEDIANPVTPFIAVFGSESQTSMVFIEKEPFTTFIALEDSFLIWFISFFVFNLRYPDGCLATLEFVQSAIFGIPTDNHSSKKAANKVLKLVKELCGFKSIWKQ